MFINHLAIYSSNSNTNPCLYPLSTPSPATCCEKWKSKIEIESWKTPVWSYLYHLHNITSPANLQPLTLSYPSWYDPSAHCDYHTGIQGHTNENYTAFKIKVWGLLRFGVLKFEMKNEPNIIANPLSKNVGVKWMQLAKENLIKWTTVWIRSRCPWFKYGMR